MRRMTIAGLAAAALMLGMSAASHAAAIASPGGPYFGLAGQTLLLNGNGSSSDTGTLLFNWDLNNDGIFTDSFSATPQFVIPGGSATGLVFLVGLTVNDGTVSSTAVYTTVTVGNAPVASVPELATWAMMLAGFGAMGTVLRLSKRKEPIQSDSLGMR